MQFHLNGFRPGDPSVSPAIDSKQAVPRDDVPEFVDVLIVGCGPAGLALATQLSFFHDIETCVVERKPERLTLGQADGIACRTVEMFEAYGFSERVLKEAYWVNETCFWKPDEQDRTRIVRSGRIQDTEDGLSEFPHVILNQARVHDFFLDAMHRSPTRLAPHYSRQLQELARDDNAPDYPVTAKLERTDAEHQGENETVRARYVVGCDGARSTVRGSLGRSLHGDSANQAWGVMDVLAVTDFPDIRLKAAIHSADEGSLLVIPREGGYLVRLYIELDKLNEDERVANRNITCDRLIAAAQRILNPYTLEVKEVAWWSVYEIGQRLCDRFDDLAEGASESRPPRIFIAGDACHTHSPKAGQGMNVSLRDSFNLGWKLASVIQGITSPQILKTYSYERQAVAKELIEFDREFAKMFSARPKAAEESDTEGVNPAEFQKYFVQQGRFTAGTATRYAPSIITAESNYQSLAEGFVVGKRFHSAPVIRLADAKPIQLGHVVRADGRWRLFAFADSDRPHRPGSLIGALSEFLANNPNSPIRKHTPSMADIDSIIDYRAIFQQHQHDFAVNEFPPILWPRKGQYGLHDYEKMFCADRRDGFDIFDMRNIDRASGCLVVVRPDQHIAHVLPLTAHEELSAFFDRFMKPNNSTALFRDNDLTVRS